METLKYEPASTSSSSRWWWVRASCPACPWGNRRAAVSPDTHLVPDGSRITPQMAPPGTRAGHDISLEVTLDAGLPASDIASKTHPVDVQSVQRAARPGATA